MGRRRIVLVSFVCLVLSVAPPATAAWLLWSEYRNDAGVVDPNHPIAAFETAQLCERAINTQGAVLRDKALGEVDTIFHRLGNDPRATTFILSPKSGPASRWDMTCRPLTADPQEATAGGR